MIVNMLHNLSHMYFSHYNIIKCIGLELIHYAINLNFASFSKVFKEFDYVFLLNILLVLINKIISEIKKKLQSPVI